MMFSSSNDVLGGATVFAGTRVSVASVGERRQRGESVESILADFPMLTAEHVEEALRMVSHTEEAIAKIGAQVAVTLSVYGEITDERVAQDAKWGGPEHDDERVEAEWLTYIHGKILAVPERYRHRGELRGMYPQRWASDAALAVAAVESYDRKVAREQKHG